MIAGVLPPQTPAECGKAIALNLSLKSPVFASPQLSRLHVNRILIPVCQKTKAPRSKLASDGTSVRSKYITTVAHFDVGGEGIKIWERQEAYHSSPRLEEI